MRQRNIGWTVLVFVIALFLPEQASGTWCRPLSACESYDSARAMFIGKVIASDALPDGSTRTRFAVREAFKGISGPEAIVVSEPIFDLPAVRLRVGQEYLVIAGENSGHQLSMSSCGAPLPSRLAVGEISFLRAQKDQSGPKTMVYGMLYQLTEEQSFNEAKLEALGQIEVDANGGSASLRTTTAYDGHFEFRNIPPGEYEIKALLPDTLSVEIRRVTIGKKSCASVPLMALWNGSISGCAMMFSGGPVSEADLTLIEKRKPRGQGVVGRTDRKGCYRFEQLQPGPYVVALLQMGSPCEQYPFPPLFYPNAVSPDLGSVIEVGKGQKLEGIDITVPYFEPHLLRVEALWSDKRPVAGARVFVEYEQSYCWKKSCILPYYTTREDGRVTFYAYGNGTVRVYAVGKHSSGKEWISEFKELDLGNLPFATSLAISEPNSYNVSVP